MNDFSNSWIWIKIRMRTLAAARAALKILGMQMHDEARVEPDKQRSGHLRAEGDHYIKEQRELQDAEMKGVSEDPDKPK